jgi:hypothetical protein
MAAESNELNEMDALASRRRIVRGPYALELFDSDLDESLSLWVSWKRLVSEHARSVVEVLPPVPPQTLVVGLDLTHRHQLIVDVDGLHPVSVSVDRRIREVKEAERTGTFVETSVVGDDLLSDGLSILVHQYRNIGLPSTWRIFGRYSSAS